MEIHTCTSALGWIPVSDFFPLCAGSRGVSVEQYPGANSQMDSLFNLDVFPDNPDSHLTYPTFEPPEAFRSVTCEGCLWVLSKLNVHCSCPYSNLTIHVQYMFHMCLCKCLC